MKFLKDDFDIIIIGAGAAGLTAAWSLSQENFKILCLDQGPKFDKFDFNKSDKKLDRLLDYSPNVRKLKSDYPIDETDSEISIANFNAIGGSTILYSAHLPRFKPSDFKVNKLDKVGANWPFGYKDLEKYYEINEKLSGVSGLEGDNAYPSGFKNLLPPLPLGISGEKIARSFNRLGWHWWPSYSGVLSKKHMGREKFERSGHYNMFIPYNSKSSLDNTYLSMIKSKKFTLLPNSRAIKINTNVLNKASEVIFIHKNKKTYKAKGSLFIIACSGIGTPRLLLNSKSEKFPNGLCNSSGLLGRNLMLHPLGYVEGTFKNYIASNIGPQGTNLYSHQFYETKEKNKFKRGYTIQVLRSGNVLNTAKQIIKFKKYKFGKSLYDIFFKYHGRQIPLAIISEDLPELKNRVELDNNKLDSSGMPGVKVYYKISKNTKEILKDGLKKGEKLLKSAGAKSVFSFAPIRYAGWHIMGTAKMGKNKKDSVVNENGFSHDVKNLLIIDSSIFPTSSAVNPVATIQAISLKISDFLKKK